MDNVFNGKVSKKLLTLHRQTCLIELTNNERFLTTKPSDIQT